MSVSDINKGASGVNATLTSLGGAPLASPAFTGGLTEQYYDAGNSGTAITIDPANGKYQKVTLTANTTITLAAVPAPTREAEIILQLVQDATGGRTVVFANITNIITGTTFAPTIASSANAITMLNIIGKNDGWNGYELNSSRIGLSTLIQTVGNNTYNLIYYTGISGRIVGVAEKARAVTTPGTFAIQINGVNVTGLTAVAPTTTGSYTAATAANTFSRGQAITITYTGSTAVLDHNIVIDWI